MFFLLLLINYSFATSIYFAATDTNDQIVVNYNVISYKEIDVNNNNFKFNSINSDACIDKHHDGPDFLCIAVRLFVGYGESYCETKMENGTLFVRSIYKKVDYDYSNCANNFVIKKSIGEWTSKGCSNTFASYAVDNNKSSIDQIRLIKRSCCVDCNVVINNHQTLNMPLNIKIEVSTFKCNT